MNSLAKCIIPLGLRSQRAFHSCSSNLAWSKPTTPTSFLEYNKKVYPPQEIGEEPRPAVSLKNRKCGFSMAVFYLINLNRRYLPSEVHITSSQLNTKESLRLNINAM